MYRNRMRCLYLKQVICRILPQRCFVFLYKILRKERRFGTISFAQEGEDRVLQRFLCDQKKGFFVDVGAYHPFRFSNTYTFYRSGWNGINIDANQDAIALFNKFRPLDINVCAVIGLGKTRMTYVQFKEGALNTCSPNLAMEYEQKSGHIVTKRSMVQPVQLRDVLNEHMPPGKEFSFLSVDVEGLDLEVLQSNDWDSYRPLLVLVEVLGVQTLNDVETTPIWKYMKDKGYFCAAKTFNTLFFKMER